MSARRVFILGAGFSKQAGMPLANELTPRILAKFEEYDQKEAREWFDWLRQRLDWLEGKDRDSCESTQINIEQVFDLAYHDVRLWRMEQQRCHLGRMDGDTPWNHAESIDAWLSYMEDDLRDIIWKWQEVAIGNMESIQRFAQNLRKDDVVLTFNYDTLLEKALEESRIKWTYGFKKEETSGVQVLKMHGSINWIIVPRNQVDNFGYRVLFKKVDKNRETVDGGPTGELEYDNALLQVPDEKLANRIENRALQLNQKQYSIGIAGLGRYKSLDELPGSGEVWYNAGRALLTADKVYVVGFSLSSFDTIARLYFAGAMLTRSQKEGIPPNLRIVDPQADKLYRRFQAVFGPSAQIDICKKKGEEVDWESFLDV